jgi:hypothetical protein
MKAIELPNRQIAISILFIARSLPAFFILAVSWTLHRIDAPVATEARNLISCAAMGSLALCACSYLSMSLSMSHQRQS